MENIIKNILMHDLNILDNGMFNYTIMNIVHRNGYDVYDIRIDGDQSQYTKALHAICKVDE